MYCCAPSPVFPRTSCKPLSAASSLPSWCSSAARHLMRSTASSTRWCRTQRTTACCAVLASNCTRRSPKRSKPIPPSSWTASPSSSRNIMARLGWLKNPSPAGARPVTGPSPARRSWKRPRNFKRGWTSWRCCRTTAKGSDRSSNFTVPLSAALHAAKGSSSARNGPCLCPRTPTVGTAGFSLGVPSDSVWAVSLSCARCEFELAQRLDDDLLRLSRQRNDAAGLVLGHLSSGVNLMSAGKFASSRSHLERALSLYDPISHRSLVRQAGIHPHVFSQAYLANTLFCLGFPDKAQLLLRQGDTEAAEELYRKALSIAEEQGAKLWELRAAMSLARLRHDQGRRAEARDLLAPIYGWFTEGFATPDLKAARMLLEKLG